MITTTMAPGVYIENEFERAEAGLRTAVPLFLGYVDVKPDQGDGGAWPEIRRLTLASQFDQFFQPAPPCGYLRQAVTGFFANGGQLCYVAPMRYNPATPAVALDAKLTALAALQAIDLICAPDIMTHLPVKESATFNNDDMATVLEMQRVLLAHCDRLGDRFAILDALGSPPEVVSRQRQALYGVNGALYFPWLFVPASGQAAGSYVPPCGHIAGIFARTDQRSGVHKAPANELLEGVSDLQYFLDNRSQGPLNAMGVNCLRAFPGRGIRIWGARTLSNDPTWSYINIRRLFLTAGRWIERNLAGLVFEPNDPRLWARLRRELTVYLNGLYHQGALRGRRAEEAFYVKCDAETNPADVRNAGQVVTEIGLAPAQPGEWIIVRIVHGAGGVTISGPLRPG